MKTNPTLSSKFDVRSSGFKVPLPGTSIFHPPSSIVLLLLLLAATSSALATVRYVNVNNANPTPPYTNWATAATFIQNAVDAAGAGDQIVVTNGTYAGGSRVDPDYAYPTRVVVDKPLTLQSVNGPDVTIINGGGTARCLYLTNNATMVGFTLTNGVAGLGGGAYCESTNAVLTNCVLTGNTAEYGGGAYGCTLNNCTLTGNSADVGGGAYGCTLNNCTLTGNLATSGGGAISCTLNNCTLTGNSASGNGSGLGVGWGGGASSSTLNNCTLTGNSGSYWGGGAFGSTLNNCTLTGNSVYFGPGGGAADSTLYNCIVYFNSALVGGNYDSYSTLNYCCTTPVPPNGVGNISADPQLASASYLSPYSPCIGAGSATYACGTDIDGEAWANPPSIGCDEYHAGAVTGPLTASLMATFTNVATGFPVGLTAFIAGRTDLSVWDFGDGDVAVNEPYTSHAWTAPGDYLVALWAFNDSYPGGVSAAVTVHVEAEVLHYVAATSSNPVAPYTSWATAATNIQNAVDAAAVGDEIVVTNGTYAPVTVNTPLTVQSVNGPDVTLINGGGTAGCLYLTNNAVLLGFTLTNGFTYGSGGGVYCESSSAVLSNCVLTGNSASYGGGAYGGTLNNCTLTGNTAEGGGGAAGCTLNNCTLTGNLAVSPAGGGGAIYCTLNNCIVYFNDGGNYDPSSTLNYCCATPLPPNGVGNISADPELASASHLSALSPCIGAGSATYASGTDIDGDAWANPPSIGCDEYHAGAVTGPLTVSLTATYTAVVTGFPVSLTAFIAGRTDLSVWDFGDGSVVSNHPYASHAWTAPGDYLVALWAYNDSYPEGVSATVTVRVLDHPVQYVALGSTNPVAPYLSWATAATNIQDAVDAFGPGALVLVTNGTYAPVVVDKLLTLQSVNGPNVTAIDGGGTATCVYLMNNAVLAGFMLTNGWAGWADGGGVYCASTNAVLTNCVLTGNSAGAGGGACGGTLNNCTLTGNSARNDGGGACVSALNSCSLSGNSAFDGGGAAGGTLNNCTLTGNSAAEGGGAIGCTLNNCIVYFNTATNGANYQDQYGGILTYCCTTPMPTNGVGNITNAPLFVNYAGGNLRLQSNSPCINSGDNAYVVGSTDLDGNPRIVGGTVDIGAYEYQTPTSIISYAWLQQYGLPTDGSADHADLDGTGMNVYQDWVAGLNPTNALSVLKMLAPVKTNNPAGLVVTWESVNTRTYYLQRGTNLGAQPAFSTIQNNIVGQAGTTSCTDTTATNAGPYFYRVGVDR